MTTPELGAIRKVDLREVWPNEAADFTPWLEQHLPTLGDALGIELEVQQIEARVGPFSLDILARDIGRGRDVVIENQLTATDHDHLGKLLTYAAGYDAAVVIWLAQEMREEHRQALDWLNQRTGANTEFFGVVVEVLRIDDSRPAPSFKLVAFPNEWRKTTVRPPGDGPVSERPEAYRTYFQGLIDELREVHGYTGARKAQAQSGYGFASGFGGVPYAASFTRGKQARVELYIDRDQEWNKRLFDGLKESSVSLETELGETLVWERLDNRQASRIAVYRDGSIDDDEDTLAEISKWMIDKLLKFKDVFGPRLSELVK